MLRERAISLFGRDIVNKDIMVQASKYENISCICEDKNKERNVLTITIKPLKMDETEEQE